jgi:hypothetical protein
LPVIVAFQALFADKQRYYVDAGLVAICCSNRNAASSSLSRSLTTSATSPATSITDHAAGVLTLLLTVQGICLNLSNNQQEDPLPLKLTSHNTMDMIPMLNLSANKVGDMISWQPGSYVSLLASDEEFCGRVKQQQVGSITRSYGYPRAEPPLLFHSIWQIGTSLKSISNRRSL